ncbi:peptidase [Niveispirillum lacus]|uniref:Peptidase n=1 Tax=Niveispirillum lacus TaxID=1981099 RepID=A0A255YY16_9PROT|nr:PepSY domain-containing protein [Niveispirillum lacus]OYQ34127.1 peptidase [Niveispirillum lacus]
MTDLSTKSSGDTGPGKALSAKGWLDYRTIWRWHFYAGLFCVPFIVALAISGALYLFKPQVEAFIDRPYDHLVLTGPAADANAQALAALAAVPDGTLRTYILPEEADDAVRVLVRDGQGAVWRVYVHPQSLEVLHKIREEDRLMQQIKKFHGELLLGDNGSLFVELAACWGIVMVVSGLYLWWPRGQQGWAGVLYPRLTAGGRTFWRDLHAVVGLWVSFLALFLLLTGLPWASVWGEAFKTVRKATGTAAVQQDWTTSRRAERAGHDAHDHAEADGMHHAGLSMDDMMVGAVSLTEVVARVTPLNLAAPVLINLPASVGGNWAVRSMTANRPNRVAIDLDGSTGTMVRREDFGDRHVIDRVVGIGIAAHEGQLFGWVNQALGVVAALGLVLLSVSGAVMWWKRRPAGALGAPPPLRLKGSPAVMGMILLGFALFLPLLGASVILVALIDLVILRQVPVARRWLGLRLA